MIEVDIEAIQESLTKPWVLPEQVRERRRRWKNKMNWRGVFRQSIPWKWIVITYAVTGLALGILVILL